MRGLQPGWWEDEGSLLEPESRQKPQAHSCPEVGEVTCINLTEGNPPPPRPPAVDKDADTIAMSFCPVW